VSTTAAGEIIIRPASASRPAATTRRIRLKDPTPMGDTPAVVTIRRRTTAGTTTDHRLTEAAAPRAVDTRAVDTRSVHTRAATTQVVTTLRVTVTTVAAMAIPEETITRADADINRATPES